MGDWKKVCHRFQNLEVIQPFGGWGGGCPASAQELYSPRSPWRPGSGGSAEVRPRPPDPCPRPRGDI